MSSPATPRAAAIEEPEGLHLGDPAPDENTLEGLREALSVSRSNNQNLKNLTEENQRMKDERIHLQASAERGRAFLQVAAALSGNVDEWRRVLTSYNQVKETVKEGTQLFKQYDASGNGLNKRELAAIFSKLEVQITDEELEEGFNKLNADGHETIGLKQFHVWWDVARSSGKGGSALADQNGTDGVDWGLMGEDSDEDETGALKGTTEAGKKESIENYRAENERLHALNRSLRSLVNQEKDDNCLLQQRWTADVAAAEKREEEQQLAMGAMQAEAANEMGATEKFLKSKISALHAEVTQLKSTLEEENEGLKRTLQGLHEHAENKAEIEVEMQTLKLNNSELLDKHRHTVEKMERDWIEERIKMQKRCSASKMSGTDVSSVEAALRNVRPHEALLQLLLGYLEAKRAGGAAPQTDVQAGDAGGGEIAVVREGNDSQSQRGRGRIVREGSTPRGHGGSRSARVHRGVVHASISLPALAGAVEPPSQRKGGEPYGRWRWKYQGMWQPGDPKPSSPRSERALESGRPMLPTIGGANRTELERMGYQTFKPQPPVNSVLGLTPYVPRLP